ISRQTIARGKPGCLGCTCQTRVRSYYPLHTVLQGAVGARLSLRPLISEGQRILQNSGEITPRGCNVLFSRHCERSEAIQLRRSKESWIASSLSLLAMTAGASRAVHDNGDRASTPPRPAARPSPPLRRRT